jgi:hypothetical protein
MPCERCASIEQNRRNAKGHDGLQETGEVTGYRPFAQAGVVITHYVCMDCGAKWSYENDKNDMCAGWSME